MTYKKLDMGKDFIGVKVQMGKLKNFNGKFKIEFSIMNGEVYLNNWSVTQERPELEWIDGGIRPEHLENGVKMYHGDYEDILNNFEVEPVYP